MREKNQLVEKTGDSLRVVTIVGSGIPKFSCKSCGQCCQSLTVPITKDDYTKLESITENRKIVDLYNATNSEYIGDLFREKHGLCVFLRELDRETVVRRCKIYVNRPFACKIFPYKYTINKTDSIIEIGTHAAADFFCKGLKKNSATSFKKQIYVNNLNYQRITSRLKNKILIVVNEFLMKTNKEEDT